MSQEHNELDGFAPYNVLAAYPDLDRVRGAIGDIEKAGIDGSMISLLGPGVEESAEEADTSERDSATVEHVGKRVGVGAAAGTAAGGGVGLLAGLASFAIPGIGPVVGAGLLASALGGAIAGGAVGGFVGGIGSLRGTEAWELTLSSVREGHTVVVIHAEEADDGRKALEAVRKTDPLTIEVFNEEGTRLQLGEADS